MVFRRAERLDHRLFTGGENTVGLDDGFGLFISAGQFKQKQDRDLRIVSDCYGGFGREGRDGYHIGRTVFGLDQKRNSVGNGGDLMGEVFGMENVVVSIKFIGWEYFQEIGQWISSCFFRELFLRIRT